MSRNQARPDAETTEHITYCRICEPLCGLVVSVTDGEVVGIRGDDDNPVTRGFLCAKGSAMVDVQRDPDRVLYPMRRVGGPGEFERCTWDEAMDDIVGRLRSIIKRHGKDSIGGYLGNPAGMHTGHMYWLTGLMAALGTPHLYSPGSQDTATFMAASNYLFGSPLPLPFPDVHRTDFLFMLGANPFISKGSMLTLPRAREALADVVARGGRVVVVDPRRSETAKAFEHVPVRTGSDAWLLLAMIREIFDAGLADETFIATHTSEVDALRVAAASIDPTEASRRTGVSVADIRELAHGFARARSAVAYTRTGVCTGPFGTLVNVCVGALNAITGNLDRPGGSVFGDPPISLDELGARFGMASVGTKRTRIGGLPDVGGLMPSTVMPAEITTPGPGQLRALVVAAGNPVLTTPGSDVVEEALGELELLVCLDLYVTETSKHAHYILPGTTFLERADLPGALLQWAAKPFVQATRAVVAPPGECREEHHFYDEVARRLGLGGPWAFRSARLLSRLRLFRPSPMQLVNLMIRTGRHGDLFGLRRGGLNIDKILESEHGIVLAEYPVTGVLARKVKHADNRVHLFHTDLIGEVERLQTTRAEPDRDLPLQLIGRRESRSHNSWMHNVPSKARQAPLQIHPDDAAKAGVVDGDRVVVRSADGAVETDVSVTDDIIVGTVTLPHGWGHDGGWQRANQRGGVNYNKLTASRPDVAEQLSGMSLLNGVPVRVEPAPSSPSTTEPS